MSITPDSMTVLATQACRLIKVLSNTDRLMLLCQLTTGEKSVGDLEKQLGIQQPTLSQQLGVLRRARIVNTRREGKSIYYQISSTQALEIIRELHSQFCIIGTAPDARPL